MILGPGKVIIGNYCRIEKDPWCNDYVTLYTHRKEAKITIGNSVILRATRFGSHLSIAIGDHSLLEDASVYDSDFHNISANSRDEDYNIKDRAVSIGSGCYIGCECLCSKGTILGKHVTLLHATGIGTKSIPEGKCMGGFPPRHYPPF